MIAFGVAISDRGLYERIALPSIRRVAEADSIVLTRYGYDSVQHPYNEMMDEVAALEDLEALVLLHQDLELLDDTLLRRVRPLLEDPRTGVIGALGWRDADLHLWSNSEGRFGRSRTPTMDIHHSVGSHEVDVADGQLLVVAPWVVRTVRFSMALAVDFHGYDVDFCLRVRARGGRAICTDVPYMHHMEKPWRDRLQFMRASRAVAQRWDPALRPREWASAFTGSGVANASQDPPLDRP